jgi:hypothetical protein
MAPNFVSTISGLLPPTLLELALLPDPQAGWRLRATLADGSFADMTFAGGTSPRAWLAQHLTAEFGMSLLDAVEVARLLFFDYLPPEPSGSTQHEPYGMPPPPEN